MAAGEGHCLPLETRPALGDVVRFYVEDRHGRGEIGRNSAEQLGWRLGGLLKTFGADRPADELDRRAIRAWQFSVGGLAPASRRAFLSTVRVFCRWAVAEGVLAVDPTADLGRVREPRRVPRALPAAKVARLLEHCKDNHRDTAVVWLMVGCGLRCVEVCRLDVDDYDPAAQTVHVRGKADNERVLPVPDPVAEALDCYLAEGGWLSGPLIRTARVVRRPADDGDVPLCQNPVGCPSPAERSRRSDGGYKDRCVACRGYRVKHRAERPASVVLGTRLDPHDLSKLMAELMVAAGVKGVGHDGISAHSLRHTALSDALDRCHDVRTIQEMAGHSSLATTQIYLRRANLDQMREAMAGRRYLVG